jgi:hypothetical protein
MNTETENKMVEMIMGGIRKKWVLPPEETKTVEMKVRRVRELVYRLDMPVEAVGNPKELRKQVLLHGYSTEVGETDEPYAVPFECVIDGKNAVWSGGEWKETDGPTE